MTTLVVGPPRHVGLIIAAAVLLALLCLLILGDTAALGALR